MKRMSCFFSPLVGLALLVLGAPSARAQMARLVFAASPPWSMPGQAFPVPPTVRAEKVDGTVDTSFTGTVTIALKPGTGASGAVLSGATTVTAASGIASFPDTSIDLAGLGYVLTATSGDLVAESLRFTVGSARAVAWGGNGSGQLGCGNAARIAQQAILTDAKQVCAGSGFSVALKNDGTVWAWGANYDGALGDGTSTNSSVPVQVQNLTDVVSVSASYGHSLALKKDGTLWSWGYNFLGQLGNGSTTASNVPVRVGSLTGIIAFDAGINHSLAVQSDGTVWAWGSNWFGQLGNGESGWTNTQTSPVKVQGLTGVVSVSAGNSHSLAQKSDGTVWAWGSNSKGQFGNGTTTDSTVPVKVQNLAGAVVVYAGWDHTLVLKGDGSVWACGWNNWGELGDGTTTDRAAPVRVSGLSGVASMSAGIACYSLAVKNDGTVWAWGSDYADGTNTEHYTPVRVSDLTGAVSVSGGNGHNVVLMADGTLWAWGMKGSGAYGDGTTDGFTVPVPVLDLPDVVSVSAGGSHSLAIRLDGKVWAWGDNSYGQLGSGASGGERRAPVSVSTLISIVSVSAGSSHTLALRKDGTVWAWGSNYSGQIGDGNSGWGNYRSIPYQVDSLTRAVSVSGGDSHSLALLADGTVWAWGWNIWGQLGDGTTKDSPMPVRVQLLAGVVSVSSGYFHSLALKGDGTVWAWGYNAAGQLGDGTTNNSSVPVKVLNLTGIASVSAGGSHSLALKRDGTVWAWGDNSFGQLGDGTTTASSVPVQVAGLSGVVSVSASNGQCLVLEGDGTIWAWGYNSSGQIGDGTFGSCSRPVRVGSITKALAVSAGFSHTLAVAACALPDHLAFRTQPVAGNAGSPLVTQPIIEALYADGTPCADFTGSVTAFVKPGTGAPGSYLTGTVCRQAVNGVAAFTDLGVDRNGTGYVIGAVCPGLSPAESAAFDVGASALYTLADVQDTLRWASGLADLPAASLNRLDVVPDNQVNLLDALRLARKVAGLEPNP